MNYITLSLEVLLRIAPNAKYIRKKTDKFDNTNLKFLCGNVWYKQAKGNDKLENLFTKYMTVKKIIMIQRTFSNQ